MLTTALTIRTETTNPATHVMDTFHAPMVSYIIGIVQTILSCGIALREDVNTPPLPVIQNIFYIEENFFGKMLILSSILFVH